jgi:4-diphosphocytidyl-2-C-methyl-D-erythritol kinase
MQLKTPSKINLYLRIVGKLPNGYNEIETVFVPLPDIYDVIKIDLVETQNFASGMEKEKEKEKGNNKITISSNHPDVPLNENNLCYKAAKLYADAVGINLSCNIDIDKNIPIAAGMGGGSSDAAAVLLLLNKKYNKFKADQLKEIALKLGADVPYFLNPVPALGKGVGEDLEEVELVDGLYVVILAPQYPVSAAWAYKNFKRPENNKVIDVKNSLSEMKSGNWKKLSELIYNDLAFALYEKFPIQNILKQEMLEAGCLNVEITGSGPTLYGICSDKNHAIEITEKLTSKYKNSFYCGYSKIG